MTEINNRKKVIVIGVDPAPSKDTVMFIDPDYGQLKDDINSGFISVPNNNVKNQLTQIVNFIREKEAQFLITWDAPLTGPAFLGGINNWPGNFTRRIIESVFIHLGEKGKYKNFFTLSQALPPEDISVQAYSGCSHWTLTKHVFNLPQMSEDDGGISKIFHRLHAQKETTSENFPVEGTIFPNTDGIVEVHPALALRLWKATIDPENKIERWNYKKNNDVLKTISTLLLDYINKCNLDTQLSSVTLENIQSDDHLDALTAWLLGKLWVNNSDEVKLVGTLATGAMLLPDPNKETSNTLKCFVDLLQNEQQHCDNN